MTTTALDPRRIAIVGIGNAGGNLLARVSREWESGPVLAVLNTDRQALDQSPVPVKIILGAKATQGLGAAADAATGRMAIEDCPAEVSGLFDEKSLVLLVAGLGGGTGTGATPVAARLAREAGALVLAVVTLPFEYEGAHIQQVANQGLAALREFADGVVVIPNQRLFAGAEGTAEEAFNRANNELMMGVSGIWRLLVQTGYQAVTFADLRTVLRQSGGTLVFGCGEGEGETRAQQAVQAAIRHPLLEGGAVLARTPAVLVSVAGGHDVTFAEISQIMTDVQMAVSKETLVRLGPALDSGLQGRIRVTLLASEAWAGRRVDRPSTGESAPAQPVPVGKAEGRPSVSGAGPRVQQEQMVLEVVGKGRFKGVEPTIVNGENLDVPTFERRGIPIPR
jgi:cell division protein FtsZ